MKDLFKDWPNIERLIKESGHALMLFDYDGTLTPIVSRPRDALLKSDMRAALKSLAGKARFTVGVVSGRRLTDVKKLVGIKGIFYAGNHGFEIEIGSTNYTHPDVKKFAKYLRSTKTKLSRATRGIKGVLVEDKGISLSVHYRLVDNRDLFALKEIVFDICNPLIKERKIHLTSGKKVWEIRLPIKWHKGKAVEKLCTIVNKKRKKAVLPAYIGDDTTDEDAFNFLNKKKRAISICVGERGAASAAAYYLKSPSEVKKFLLALCRI